MDFRKVLGMRASWIVVGTLVVGGSALLVSLLLPRTYTAEARVLISGSDPGMVLLAGGTGSASLPPDRDMATEAEIVRSRPVVAAAIGEARLNMTASGLLDALAVSPVGQTNILAISARAGTPDDAARIANAVARAYIESSTEQRRDSLGRAADQVSVRVDELGASIRALRGSGSDKATKSRKQVIQESMDQKSIERYSHLAVQLDLLRLSKASVSGTGRLVSEALADPNDFAPSPLRTGILGLLVGFLASVAVAFTLSPVDVDEPKTPRRGRTRGVTHADTKE